MSRSSKIKSENQKKAKETFDELCIHLENQLDVQIPLYIRNILIASGFNNRLTMRSLSEKDLDHLENFARSETYENFCHSQFAWKDLYSIYAPGRNSTNFEIPPGHRRLLLCLADYLKQTFEPSKTIT